jgi:hypothetical protein
LVKLTPQKRVVGVTAMATAMEEDTLLRCGNELALLY